MPSRARQRPRASPPRSPGRRRRRHRRRAPCRAGPRAPGGRGPPTQDGPRSGCRGRRVSRAPGGGDHRHERDPVPSRLTGCSRGINTPSSPASAVLRPVSGRLTRRGRPEGIEPYSGGVNCDSPRRGDGAETTADAAEGRMCPHVIDTGGASSRTRLTPQFHLILFYY